jgi:hypothetical protein
MTLEGNCIRTAINGVKVAEFDPSVPVPGRKNAGPHGDLERGPRPRAGYIGLQNHDEGSVVYFKEGRGPAARGSDAVTREGTRPGNPGLLGCLWVARSRRSRVGSRASSNPPWSSRWASRLIAIQEDQTGAAG